MVCRSKRYIVEAIIDGKEISEHIAARTPAEARRKLREKYGKSIEIIAVKKYI